MRKCLHVAFFFVKKIKGDRHVKKKEYLCGVIYYETDIFEDVFMM